MGTIFIRKIIYSTIALILFISGNSLIAQSKEEWYKIFEDDNKLLFLNTKTITKISDEIYFWTFEEYKNPLTIDEIEESIYSEKTYYVINKELNRYRIIDVIYYDKDKNVIKSFHYNSSYEDPIYKYNMPILASSDMELVLKKILTLLENSNN